MFSFLPTCLMKMSGLPLSILLRDFIKLPTSITFSYPHEGVALLVCYTWMQKITPIQMVKIYKFLRLRHVIEKPCTWSYKLVMPAEQPESAYGHGLVFLRGLIESDKTIITNMMKFPSWSLINKYTSRIGRTVLRHSDINIALECTWGRKWASNHGIFRSCYF